MSALKDATTGTPLAPVPAKQDGIKQFPGDKHAGLKTASR